MLMSQVLSTLLYGASGHASVVADALRLEGRFSIIGCVDDRDPQPRSTPAGTVLGSGEALPALRQQGITHILIAIGDNVVRLGLAQRALALGFELATAIHPRATVAQSATIGAGSVLMAGSVVNPGASIGSNCIINTCSCVDHDCELGEGVHICPGAHLAGHVQVGAGTMIGVGAAVRDQVRIGKGCIIGAGAAVVCDIPDYSVAVGVPARVVRQVGPIIV